MKNFLIRFVRYLQRLGIGQGLKIFSKITFSKKEVQFSLAGYPSPIYLRTQNSDVKVFDQIFVSKGYQVKVPFDVKTIIDCGANIGLSAVYLARQFPNASIVAVEPDAANFEMIKKNTAGYPAITSLKKGIWDKECYLDIKQGAEGPGWAFITEESTVPTNRSIHSITIAQIMQQMKWQAIDMLKVDIEGAEKQMFTGDLSAWLPAVKVIYIELHEGLQPGATKAFYDAIKPYGFSVDKIRENVICIKQ